MDRWELNVGDSLIDKIQHALTKSGAILLILSKNSVDSAWVRKELNAGLMRELEEKKSLLLPCVIDDCEIPLFLREKRYADFKADRDQALSDVDRALAAISNPYQGRTETPDFHTDWAVSWGDVDGDPNAQFVEFAFVDHGHAWPYIILCLCLVRLNQVASRRFLEAQRTGGREFYIRDLLKSVIDHTSREELTVTIDSPLPKKVHKTFAGRDGEKFLMEISSRRMGIDNGMDTIFYADNNLHRALDHMNEALYRPPNR